MPQPSSRHWVHQVPAMYMPCQPIRLNGGNYQSSGCARRVPYMISVSLDPTRDCPAGDTVPQSSIPSVTPGRAEAWVMMTGTPFALKGLVGGVKMLQHCQGQRCQATRSIRGHQGLISAHTQGTIEAEISNLGRHLIAVRWDNAKRCRWNYPPARSAMHSRQW